MDGRDQEDALKEHGDITIRSEGKVTDDRSDTEFVGTEHESKGNRHKPVESSFP